MLHLRHNYLISQAFFERGIPQTLSSNSHRDLTCYLEFFSLGLVSHGEPSSVFGNGFSYTVLDIVLSGWSFFCFRICLF